MIHALRFRTIALLALAAFFLPLSVRAQAQPAEIGVVVMHGKAGDPGKSVNKLAQSLEKEGFQVANLEMPWSAKRQYDVDMNGAVNEITAALEAMRAKGAKKLFVAGHSQGGLFTLHYGSRQTVDGLVAIAPGASHGAPDYRSVLGGHVGTAKSMIAEGRGAEKAEFADQEGSRGTYPITATASVYYDWFNPDGPHNMWEVVKHVKSGVPVLYVAPTRDYPALKKQKQTNFSALPGHPLTRLFEPDSDHLNAPGNASAEIIRWINEVAGK